MDNDLERYFKPSDRKRRESIDREDDKATRARLERQSPRVARVNFVDHLNAISRMDASRQAPGLSAINAIREMETRLQNRRRSQPDTREAGSARS